MDEQNACMVAALERGVEDGTLRPVDARSTATVLSATWNGVISLAWRPDDLRQTEDQLRTLLALTADIVSRGLRER